MYAQISYSQKLGNGPYSIADAGCLLTAFSNLLARFGEPIDPPALNQEFINKGSYLLAPEDGPSVRDDLSWGSVSAHDGQVAVVGIGGAGWPDSNDAIVKFIYTSPRTGHQVTHFCLVADHAAGTILDSWDGVTKVSPYGAPVAWAKYERHIPQVVTPPAAPEVPAFTIESIGERVETLKITTHLWDLNQRSWPGLVNNPVGTGNAGTDFKTNQIAYHVLGGSYYLPEGSTTQGYNVVDCVSAPEAAPAPAPTPAPAPKVFTENVVDGITIQALDNAPRQMWVSRPNGAEKWVFKGVTTWRGFRSVQHYDYGSEIFISAVAHHPIPPKGVDYYMTSDDFGDFKKTGEPANYYGFNWSDISDKRPPALTKPAEAPAPVAAVPAATKVSEPAAQVETAPAASTSPVGWQATFVAFPKAVHYIATRELHVSDLSGQQPAMTLPKYNPGTNDKVGVVSAFGTVVKDGIEYYRLKTNNDPEFAFWYCIPKLDPASHTPNLLVLPSAPVSPIGRSSVARDTFELAKARLETDVPKFLDDILPKWFKNKK